MSEHSRWLIVGLGNPGRRYAGNRHNVGFHVVERIAVRARGGASFRDAPQFRGRLASLEDLGDHGALLLAPQTYMNLSGESVRPVAERYHVPVERIVAIHDDVDLPPGRLKLKRGGGDGGHKGIRSMCELLGDGDFVRVRVGVGRPSDPDIEVADFVLADFDEDERETMDEAVTRAAQAVQTLIAHGLSEAMNRFNRNSKPQPKKPEREDPAPSTAEGADPTQNSGSTDESVL